MTENPRKCNSVFLALLINTDNHKSGVAMELTLESKAYGQDTMIPKKYTCDGANISPPLSWAGVPEETKSFALIFDDPDAPTKTWVHWLMYNIPADQTHLQEDIPISKQLPNGALQGINDFKKYGYGGPCPPGGTHGYYMKLYALDILLDEKPGLTKEQLLDVMDGHILAKTELVGKYKRSN